MFNNDAFSSSNYSSSGSLSTKFNLRDGEKILWSGRPKQGLVFQSRDLEQILFILAVLGFFALWTVSAKNMGAPWVYTSWGIMSICFMLFYLIGHFFVEAYRRRKTYYGLTNERAIIISGLTNLQEKSVTLKTNHEISIEHRGNDEGTISFGPIPPLWRWRTRGRNRHQRDAMMPAQFVAIPDASSVHKLILDVQQAETENNSITYP